MFRMQGVDSDGTRKRKEGAKGGLEGKEKGGVKLGVFGMVGVGGMPILRWTNNGTGRKGGCGKKRKTEGGFAQNLQSKGDRG